MTLDSQVGDIDVSTLLLYVVPQAARTAGLAITVDACIASRWPMRGRDQAPEAPCGVGTSRAVRFAARR
jgi:hypothetical protein